MSLVPGSRLGHYDIRASLGAGGMGEVYRATDSKLGRDVALKVLPANMATHPERLERFRREAKALAAVDHPGIVIVHSVEEVDGTHFLTMQLVEGRSLDRAVPPEGLPAERIVEIAIALADALAAAHDRGIVHRDLKPANIMLTHDGRVKVLDFGLAKIAGEPGDAASQTDVQTRDGMVMGTVPYMSPEQIAGRTVDHRTDLFSLGIVLYEMAAGRRPFEGASSAEVTAAILRDTPSPLGEIRSDLPADLVRIARRCLEKLPNDRVQTARDVCNELRDIGRHPPSTRVPSVPYPIDEPRHVAAPSPARVDRHTVGRQPERERLVEAFALARTGRGLLMCIAGEPGIGKTTLVEDFLGDLTATDACTIARGRCSERLAGNEAYLPLLEALAGLVQSADTRPGRVMKQVAPTWYAQIAPSAGREDSGIGAAEARSSSQERMKRELVVFLQELSRSGPVVLFFDDLQWADVSTVDAISYLAAKFEQLGVLIVVTYRPSDMLLARHPFLQIKPDLQARGVCRELTLEFLSQADVAEYLSLECPGHLFPLEFSRLIHAKTEGSPLFVADLVRYLRDRGALAPSSGGWTLADTLPSIERELPESVRGMIERKIAQLSDDDRTLLAAASVQGYEFDSAVLAHVLNLEADLVEERLETLERVFAFVRLTSEVELPDGTLTLRYRFVHVLYQNALYASLRPTRRATLNAAVAGVLVRMHGAQQGAIAAQLAVLYAAARDFTRAVEYFLLASQQATRVFAHAEGVALASRGLELLEKLPENPDRARLELRLRAQQGGSLMVLKGFGAPEVLATYTRQRDLSRQVGDDAQLLRSEFGLSIAYTVRAEYRKAQELAAGCLTLATETGDDQMQVQAHFSLGLNAFFLADAISARHHFETTIALYDPSKHRAIALYGAIVNRAHLARVMIWLGDEKAGRAMMDEALAAADAARHPVGVINTLSVAAFIEAFYRRPAEIIAITDRMITLAEENGYPYFHGIGLILRGLAQTIAHHDARGIDLMREGLAVHQTAETWQHQTTYLILLAEALGEIGRTDEGLRALLEAETAMARTGERYYEAGLHEVRATLQAQQGNLSAAEASLAQAIDVARQQRANVWEARAAASLAQLWGRHGRQEEADRLLADIAVRQQEGS